MARKPRPAIDWSATTWEGARKRQLERWATLTLDEILDAQEMMADLARELAPKPPRRATPRGKPRGRR
ncbi:MAG: hypothetical protein HUU15_06050 [Candidatus Brocadiae bacterium]|nr:hypothetical protein [Candidatus Brocadiia bacterium]